MNNLEIIENKIIPSDRLSNLVSMWRFKDETIVFSNGCFDILHYGHIHLLSKAREFGHKLIIGMNSDASANRLKGEGRPINAEHERSMLLASLHVVDAVAVFEEDTPLELIKTIQPHVLVKGGDYKADEVVGADEMKTWGGRVEIVDFLDGYSSTGVSEKIKS